jgi:hypothetical protein
MTTLGSVSTSTQTPAASTSAASSTAETAAATPSSALAAVAVRLSADAGVVATLGGTSTSLKLYDAAGLLDSIARAGTSEAATSTDTSAATESADQAIVSSLAPSSSPASTASASGVYTSVGSLNSASDLTSSWASILQTDPGAAASLVASSYAQGILSTIA